MTNEYGLSTQNFNAVKFLRSSKEAKIMEAVMADKRVEAVKGNHLSRALLSTSYSKMRHVPIVSNQEEAEKVLQEMLEAGVFVRAKPMGNSRVMQPDLTRTWSDDALYVWVYQGSQLMTILGAIAFLLVSFFLASYQMWPSSLRHVTWYIMMLGFIFIGFLLITSIIRLIFFIITYFAKPPGIWIFPNLFEDVSFIDSFIPLWDWHGAPQPKKSTKKQD